MDDAAGFESSDVDDDDGDLADFDPDTMDELTRKRMVILTPNL